jgi:hypothetical protein
VDSRNLDPDFDRLGGAPVPRVNRGGPSVTLCLCGWSDGGTVGELA